MDNEKPTLEEWLGHDNGATSAFEFCMKHNVFFSTTGHKNKAQIGNAGVINGNYAFVK